MWGGPKRAEGPKPVKTETASNLQFRGEFPAKLDSGWRVSLPKVWRDRCPEVDWVVVPWPLVDPDCLAAFPMDSWDRLHTEIMVNGQLTPGGRQQILDLLARRSFDTRIDKVGRLGIGQRLANQVGLKEDVVLAGGGRNYIRIIPAERYVEFDRRSVEGLSRETLKQIGLA
ncbi:MAG: hypothetical protein D6766_13455 [Verrucomicrobia bacterium]|nr:MAG: hypothetical protein D6766_13455 [Verrucomicrobiota bacterium]